ncbi:MAG: HAMP domain-containing protein [Anaerolineales bacterium]|nr:HAMP domain-containing protein [Anaerolineales bacterium]
MTLRFRLTLWYSAVLAVIILLFSSVVYGLTGFTLVTQVDVSLRQTAKDIINKSQIRRVLDVQFLLIQQQEVNRFSSQRVYVQVWRANGTWVANSDNLGDYQQPLDPAALQRDHGSAGAVVNDGSRLRVVTEPIFTTDGQLLGYVQAAAPLDQVDLVKSALLIVLVSGGLAAVMLAAVVGWLSANRALRPLDTITQTALQITRADDLSRRIPLRGVPKDEVGRLAQAFNDTLERLERLFNAQRRFLADVSHELRTPLTTIRGNVDLLRRMGGADPDSLDAIQSEAERMSRLVGDLLLLAQSDAGTLPLAHDPVELDTLLLEVLREAQVLASGVQLTIGEIDQAVVIGDRDRLKQLLLNLVSNALKFTPEGGRVTLGLARAAGNWARLVVTDTGVGIPPSELPFIFERFYRVDKARTRSAGGAGLGLAIAQRIAHVHGGRIEAMSAEAGGSTFCVWLPLAPERVIVEAAKLTDTRPNLTIPAGLKKLRRNS